MDNNFYKTKEWQKTRAKAIALNKRRNGGRLICQICFTDIQARANVDHIKRLRDHFELAHDQSNLQVLHATCHSKSKQIEESNKNKPEVGVDGYPLGGGW